MYRRESEPQQHFDLIVVIATFVVSQVPWKAPPEADRKLHQVVVGSFPASPSTQRVPILY